MKKFTFLIGMATGFVVGSRIGRGPYERLETSVRQAINQPKVQNTLHSAADRAKSVRDSALDATTETIDDVSDAATTAIDETSKRIRNGTQDVPSKVRNRA